MALRVARRVPAGARTVYRATVGAPGAGAGPVPTGGVGFSDHGRAIAGCADRPVSGGRAACGVTFALPGRHLISAAYAGDGGHLPSTSAAVPQTVTRAPHSGTITATLHWAFYFSPVFTRVLELTLTGPPYGTQITLGCRGGGCPSGDQRWTVGPSAACAADPRAPCAGPDTVDLRGGLAGDQLSPGARIRVFVEHAGWVGKYYRFTVRAGRGPAVLIGCLAPGGSQPGAGCHAPRRSGPAPGAGSGTG